MTFPRIAKLFPLLLAFSLTAGAAEKGTLREFAAVRYDRNALVLTSSEYSKNFVCKIGSSEAQQVGPDRELDLPLDQKSNFLPSRHTALVFTPLENVRGFKVERICDFRSVRRGMSTEEFTITIETDGTLTFGEITNVMIPGSAGK